MKSNIVTSNFLFQWKKHSIVFLVIFIGFISLSLFLYHFGTKQTFLIFSIFIGIALFFKFPELGLVLSVSTYLFKRWLVPIVPIFSNIDFTVFVFSLTFISILFYLVRKDYLFYLKFNATLISFMVFGVFLLISTLYTPASEYGMLKATSFLTFNLALFLFPMLVINSEDNIHNLLIFFAILGGTYSVLTLVNLYTSFVSGNIIYTYRASFLGINPIGFANWFGSVAVIFIVIIPAIKNKYLRFGNYLLILLFTIIIVVSNSRGPIISFILTIIIFSIIRARQIKRKNTLIWTLLIIITLIVLYAILPSQFTDRYTQLAKAGGEVNQRVSSFTITSRIEFWKASVHFATESVKNLLVGVGSGGFSKMYFHLDLEAYPHNIFFEVFCELGLIGLFLLLWHFYSVFKYIFDSFVNLPKRQKDYLLAFTMAAIYNIIAAQFSSDLIRNRRIWFFMGVAIAIKSIYSWRNIRKTKELQNIDSLQSN